MKKLLLYFAVILSFISVSFFPLIHAGWFGSDNFEECVLDKMKGQNIKLFRTASKACRKIFPDSDEELLNILIKEYEDMDKRTNTFDHVIVKAARDRLLAKKRQDYYDEAVSRGLIVGITDPFKEKK